jgi:signal transduction histidine kinase
MIDKEMLEKLDTKEKDTLKDTLKGLIEQTYAVENEYKELKKSYDNLQSFIKQVVEVLPNAIWVIDEDEKIFLENSEAKKISNLIKKIDTDKESDEIEYNQNYYLVKTSRAFGKKIVSATDITQEKRSERLASMGQIAAHLSHEIRNPIGSVSLTASTLLKRVTPKNKPLVEEIKKAIWRVERIIKATLLFTKGVSIHKSCVKTKEFEEEIKTALEYYAYSKEIDIEFDIEDSIIEVDFDLFSIVLQNFIFNAIDAIEEDEGEDGWVRIVFKEGSFFIFDSAPEIEDTSILYEPFKTTKTKGHGLGLALSLEILNAHNATIELLKDNKGFKIGFTS